MIKRQFTVTDGKYTATVKVFWAKESRWSSAHYSASIKVPFKPLMVHNLFVYDEAKIDEAVAIAEDYAKLELSGCTLI